MEFWSWTIAVILGLSAIASPIATAIINNIFQDKRENVKNYELAKRQALTDFIKSTSEYQRHNAPSSVSNYYSALNTLYIYFDIDKPASFLGLESSLQRRDVTASTTDLTNIVVTLSKQIKRQ